MRKRVGAVSAFDEALGITPEIPKERPSTKEMKVTSEKVGKPIEEDFLPEGKGVVEPEEKVVTKTRVVFESANSGKPLTGGFERIVEKIVVTDVIGTYERLEAELFIGETRGDRSSVAKALDTAEKNGRSAFKLWTTAKLEVERWQKDNLPVIGAMREEASRALQQEKDAGQRNKQITNGDVEAQAATMFPEQWMTLHVQKGKVERMEADIKDLNEKWTSKARSLQSLAALLR